MRHNRIPLLALAVALLLSVPAMAAAGDMTDPLISRSYAEGVFREETCAALDAVAAGAFRLSRSAAAEAIAAGLVQLNYSPCLKPDAPVRAGDVLSLRGKGKAAVLDAGGHSSKKGRLFIKVGIYR